MIPPVNSKSGGTDCAAEYVILFRSFKRAFQPSNFDLRFFCLLQPYSFHLILTSFLSLALVFLQLFLLVLCPTRKNIALRQVVRGSGWLRYFI